MESIHSAEWHIMLKKQGEKTDVAIVVAFRTFTPEFNHIPYCGPYSSSEMHYSLSNSIRKKQQQQNKQKQNKDLE